MFDFLRTKVLRRKQASHASQPATAQAGGQPFVAKRMADVPLKGKPGGKKTLRSP